MLAASSFALIVSSTISLRDGRAHAQTPGLVAQRDDHIRRQHAILGYLAGSAGLSLAGGTALLLTEPSLFAGEPKELRTSFAMLNLIYGAVNTAFVAASFAGIEKQRETITSPWLLAEDRRRQARALAMNGGLDMIYITLGLTLWATHPKPLARGMGLGIALQGALLLGFDGAGALLMSR